MRYIHSKEFATSLHFIEFKVALEDVKTRFKGALSYCKHCDAIHEKSKHCPVCHHETKEMPTNQQDQEAFLMAEYKDELVIDYRWTPNGKQLHFMSLNGRD